MKAPHELRQTLSKIRRNKETLFAVLLAGTRWYTGGLVMPLSFVICRLLLERLIDNHSSAFYRSTLGGDTDNQSLLRSYEEAMKMVDAESKKNRDIQLEMEYLGDENQRLKTLLDEANAQAIVTKFETPVPSGDLERKIKELERKRADLEEQLKTECQAKNALESEKREAVAFRDAEARQNRIFKKEIERLQNDTKKMKEMEMEIGEKTALIANRDQAIAQLAQESIKRDKTIEQLELNIQELKNTVHALREQSASLNDNLENERDVVRSLEKDLQESKQKATEKGQLYDMTMKSLLAEKETASSLESRVHDLCDILDTEREKLQEREAIIAARDEVIEELKDYESRSHELTKKLKSTIGELDEAKETIAFTEARLASTEEKLSEVKEENKQIAVLQDQVNSLEYTVKEGESALRTTQANLETVSQELENTLSELEDALDAKAALQNEHSILQEKYEAVSDAMELLEAEKGTTQRLSEEVASLTKSLEASEESNASLRNTLNQKTTLTEAKVTLLAEAESKNQMLQKEVDALKMQVSEMASALEDAAEKEKRAQEVQSAFEVEKDKTAQLEEKLEETSSALEAEIEKSSSLEKTLNEHRRKVEDAEATIESLEVFKQKADEESRRAEDIENEVSRLNNYLGSMRLNVDELQETLEEKESRIAELTEINASLTSGKEDLVSEFTALKAELQQKQSEIEKMERKLKFELDKVATLSEENQVLKEKNLKSVDSLVTLQSSLVEKDATIESKIDEVAQLQKSIDDSKARYTEERSVANNLAQELRTRNERLVNKAAEAREKLEELKESSNEKIKKLEESLEETKESLNKEQMKVQHLEERLKSKEVEKNNAIGGLAESMDGELAHIKKQLADAMSKYEAEKAKVNTLESTRKTSQKMIHDLEAILDKKEVLLQRRLEEITSLKDSLAESNELIEAKEKLAYELEEKIKAGEHSAELIEEMKTRENHMKKSLADATQNTLKLRDMLLASGAFHGSKGPLPSPRGAPTPETMSTWGKHH